MTPGTDDPSRFDDSPRAEDPSGFDSPPRADDPSRFDDLWDYDDPASTEARFREILPRLEAAKDASLALQLRTQIARTMSLRRRFDEAHALLDDVAARLDGAPPVVRVRYLLERGRTLNSAGRASDARPLFLDAFAIARTCGEDGFAVDAAHMVAIVETGDASVRWNEMGLALARTSKEPRARRWRGSLLNNLAWTHHGRGELERAHALFEEALEARREDGKPAEIDVARWCVARSLRSLGRVDEALAAQRLLLSDMDAAGRRRDGFVFEEIAECLLALGRADEARPWCAKAWDVLSKLEWLVASEPARLERLRRLGEEPKADRAPRGRAGAEEIPGGAG
ncbi:MAG: tetratricopeptide repeat protein [bacterium]